MLLVGDDQEMVEADLIGGQLACPDYGGPCRAGPGAASPPVSTDRSVPTGQDAIPVPVPSSTIRRIPARFASLAIR